MMQPVSFPVPTNQIQWMVLFDSQLCRRMEEERMWQLRVGVGRTLAAREANRVVLEELRERKERNA